MRFYLRKYFGPNDDDLFILLFDEGGSILIRRVAPGGVTGDDLDDSDCMFKLPAGSYAILDVLEDQLIDRLEAFLLELGHGFCFKSGHYDIKRYPCSSDTDNTITVYL